MKQEKTMKHTPTPWKVERCPCGHPSCKKAMVAPIAMRQGLMSNEDAQFIVKAVNCHDEMVEVLKEACGAFDLIHGEFSGTADFVPVHKKIKAALAKEKRE